MADHTARSRFLAEALQYYETGNAEALFDLANDFSIEITPDEDDGCSQEDNKVLNEMNAKLRELHGNDLVAARLTVGQRTVSYPGSIIIDHVKRLSPERRNSVTGAFLNLIRQLGKAPAPPEKEAEVEALDTRYARELVELLPTVVAKASTLQDLELKSIPKPSVQRYFREAHYCYFFGLNRACAVLCRAILEAALKEKLGADNLWQELIDKASQARGGGTPLLDGERIEAAKKMYRAGNLAVHDEERFDIRYQDTAVEALLLDMRKILEDLYSASIANT